MNKRWLSIILVLLFVGVVTAGVALFVFPYDPLSPPEADDTGFTQEGVQEVVNANNKFAFDFYNQILETEKENLFFSPYSLSTALAMTYEGAKGQTAEEMKDVFYFPENQVLRPNSAAIYNQINKKDKSYTLRTGNALWVQHDYPFLEDYLTTVANYYGGKAANLDFVNETEKSRVTINDFISKQTNNRIKDLIPEGILSSDTRLVLTNAIYFLGDWKYQFDKKNTKDLDFFITPNNPVKVPMMQMTSKDMKNMKPEPARFNYADLEKLQIIELPYKDDELSMIIILSKQGEEYDSSGQVIQNNYTLEDIEFSFEKFNEYKLQMNLTSMDSIYLPKFEFETEYGLNDVLIDLGMPTAFTGSADFSGMTGSKDLFIGAVLHKAFIKVDEEGTEAAAATAVSMDTTAMMPQNIFIADHPFMFVIQEKQTGNILFMGNVIDPSS
jgi:serine protease inhibitor